MEIRLNAVSNFSDFVSAPLRNRALVSAKAAITQHYVAIAEEQEVAFVAIDLPTHKEHLCVYELLVDPACRQRGYGSEIIRKLCKLAVQGGFKRICLIPRPIEEDGSEESLRVWYSKLGFVQCSKQRDLMEIILTPRVDEGIA